jgi:hypothetical protein
MHVHPERLARRIGTPSERDVAERATPQSGRSPARIRVDQRLPRIACSVSIPLLISAEVSAIDTLRLTGFPATAWQCIFVVMVRAQSVVYPTAQVPPWNHGPASMTTRPLRGSLRQPWPMT